MFVIHHCNNTILNYFMVDKYGYMVDRNKTQKLLDSGLSVVIRLSKQL